MFYRYFPANYVTAESLEVRGDTPTEPPEVVGISPQKETILPTAASTAEERCVALFTYASDEPGDLTFEAGESVTIVKKVISS